MASIHITWTMCTLPKCRTLPETDMPTLVDIARPSERPPPTSVRVIVPSALSICIIYNYLYIIMLC